MKKEIKIIAALCLLVLVIAVLLGFAAKPKEKEWTTYTVCPGDRLWDIATELGIQNRGKWVYETCEINGIRQGGMIYPGDIIITYKEVR